MKRYIVCDEYSDYKNISDYKDLKKLLIDELKRDTFENCEQDIVENNFKVMEKLALEDYTDINYLKEQLMGFGWYVMDLIQLQQDLSNFQTYKHGAGCPCIPHDCIEETLEMIDREMREV